MILKKEKRGKFDDKYGDDLLNECLNDDGNIDRDCSHILIVGYPSSKNLFKKTRYMKAHHIPKRR